MAQKGKNENLKDRKHEGSHKKPYKKVEQGSTDCGNSIGIMDHLLNAPGGPSAQGVTATDRLTVLRRQYKKVFGFKPVGMNTVQLEAALRSRGVDLTDTLE